MLGWKIERVQTGCYPLLLPRLSAEEENLVAEVCAELAGDGKRLGADGIEELLREKCRREDILLSETQKAYITNAIIAEAFGFGVLEPLLSDANLEEIAVFGVNKQIHVYKRGEGWLRTNSKFTTETAILNAINKMARGIGRRITMQSPRLNAVLPDGSRLHASIPPISDYEITIRKFRSSPLSIPELILLKAFSAEALAMLWLLMQSDVSLIIAGNTSSGKTSTLNALFSFVPLDERVIISEETPEINIPHAHKVRLLSNAELGISMSELAAESLRMRPDRLVIGEARTKGEITALFDSLLSGQAKGSYATFHAQSARDALLRLRALGIGDVDLCALNMLIIQRRFTSYDAKKCAREERRRVVEICEITQKNSAPCLKKIFSYDMKNDALTFSKTIPESALRIGLGRRELIEEMELRKRFLSYLAGKNLGFSDSISHIQGFSFDKEFRKKWIDGHS